MTSTPFAAVRLAAACLVATCLAAACSTAAAADGAAAPGSAPNPAHAAEGADAKTVAEAQAKSQAKSQALSDDMAATLRKAGFTELQILPNSLFVRGKDKAGHPVAMVLNPGSMTEMVVLDPHAGTAAGGNGAPLTGSGTFAAVLPGERLASALIGLSVADPTGAKIGTIKDIAIDRGGIHAYVVGIGGLLGIGDHDVAVTPGALQISEDGTTHALRATIAVTADELKKAPAFEDLTKR